MGPMSEKPNKPVEYLTDRNLVVEIATDACLISPWKVIQRVYSLVHRDHPTDSERAKQTMAQSICLSVAQTILQLEDRPRTVHNEGLIYQEILSNLESHGVDDETADIVASNILHARGVLDINRAKIKRQED